MADSSEGYSDGVEDAPEEDDDDALVTTQAALARAAAQAWGAGEDPCYKATFPVRDTSNILMRARNVGYFGMGDLAYRGEVAKNVTFASGGGSRRVRLLPTIALPFWRST